ncbi:hypothetical protein Glove_64g104 [Diversispora epigaea]|uniref:Uncharacterized protein n=1 Tax=Diversispora epigaea TaxID=1348612 RepID=A0A397JC02_9GLOM|nr:hypothetical protein Glove_64g104 [Diversispora epigaea]
MCGEMHLQLISVYWGMSVGSQELPLEGGNNDQDQEKGKEAESKELVLNDQDQEKGKEAESKELVLVKTELSGPNLFKKFHREHHFCHSGEKKY